MGTEMDRRREKLLGSNGTNSRFSSSRQFDTILGLVSWGQLNSKTLLGRAREKIRFSELSATDSKGERVHQKLVKCKSCCYSNGLTSGHSTSIHQEICNIIWNNKRLKMRKNATAADGVPVYH